MDVKSGLCRLYDTALSGNAWKVRLCLAELGRPYERVTLDPVTGDLESPAFRKISRRGRVPVLVEEGRVPLVESGAILVHLARGSFLLPDKEEVFGQTLSWLFWEQADLSRPLALPRFFRRRGLAEGKAKQIDAFLEEGRANLAFLDRWLSDRPYLTGESYTLADLACHAYVFLAPEGGQDLSSYHNVTRWLSRIMMRPAWMKAELPG